MPAPYRFHVKWRLGCGCTYETVHNFEGEPDPPDAVSALLDSLDIDELIGALTREHAGAGHERIDVSVRLKVGRDVPDPERFHDAPREDGGGDAAAGA